MVNTRGHLTEYGKDLMNVAKASGAHVVIMADYDASGVKIASESPSEMPWIGANDKMLEYFHLARESVSIESDSKQNKAYIRRLVKNGKHDNGRIDWRFKDVDVDFLEEERVELDAILAKVGDERFFQYLLDTLKGLYPKRDYNRAIEIPSEGLETRHEKILSIIHARVESIIADEADKIREELSDVLGFLDVKEKLKEIKERLSRALTEDPEYEDFTDKLDELIKSHPFFKNNNKASGD